MRAKPGGKFELRVALGFDPATKRYRYRSKTVVGTKRVAETALAALVAEVTGGKKVGTDATLGVAIDRWLELSEAQRSPTTMHEYRRLVAKRIRPALGDVKLSILGAEQIDRLYLGLQGDGLAPGSIRQVHAIIRRACAQAVKWGWIERNPAVDASPPSVRRGERAATTPDHARALIAAASDDERLAALIRVAAATGARRGELCGLRVDDLHLDDGWLAIRRSVVLVGGQLATKGTKTNSERQVDLDPMTIAAIRAHLDRAAATALEGGIERDPNPWVWSSNVSGSTPWRPDRVTGQFRTTAKRAGLAGLRFHDLRHLHATMLLDAGLPTKAVSARLGHARESTTQDIYSHVIRRRDAEAAAMVGLLLD